MSSNNNPSSNGNPARDFSKGLAPMAASGPYRLAGPNGSSPSGDSGQGFTLPFVLNALRRRWKLATPIGLLLAAGAVALIWRSFEPQYRASAWLEIQDRRPHVAFPDRYGPSRFVQTQVQLITSPLVIQPALSRPEVAGLDQIKKMKERTDPLEWAAKNIQVTAVGDSQLYTVSYIGPKGNSPDDEPGRESAAIVNAVLTAYLELWRGEQDEGTTSKIEDLQGLLDDKEDIVKQKRVDYSATSVAATGIDPFALSADSPGVLMPLASALEASLARAEAERAMARLQLDNLSESFDDTFDLGVKGRTSGDAKATVILKGDNNDFGISVPDAGAASIIGLGNVDVVFVHDKATGDEAIVTLDAEKGLRIDVDPFATRAKTVVEEITAQGTFQADLLERDGAADAGNDGSGLVCTLKVQRLDAEAFVANDREVQALEAALSANEESVRELEEKWVGIQDQENPLRARYTQLKGDSTRVRAQLDRRCREVFFSRREEELSLVRNRLTQCELTENVLRERCDEEAVEKKEYGGDKAEAEFARQEWVVAEGVAKIIRDRIMELETEQNAPDQVKIRQDAIASTSPIEWLPIKKMLMAALAALCFPFGLVVLWERLTRRVSDARQLEQQSMLPVIAEVARLPMAKRDSGRSSRRRVGRDVRIFEESIDSLRTYLALSEPLKDARVLAVTSAANNEGKTSVAVQLAVSIARASGERTLLIDGDMRSPDIQRVLDLPLEPGLVSVLEGECTLEEAVITTWSKKVHVLTAGKLQGSPHQLLGNGAVTSILDEVRSSYRYVIIDTPPVLAAGEALVLATAADASLICTMRDVSRVDQVNSTRERLLAAGARPVGVVLNGVPTKAYAYRYGSYEYTR